MNLDQCKISNEEQCKAITKLQDTVNMLLSKFMKQDELNADYKSQNEMLLVEVDNLKNQANTRPDHRCKYLQYDCINKSTEL